MTTLYRHPFTFDVHYEERENEGWTFDCGQKRDYDPDLIRFSCRVWPDASYTCSLMLGEEYLRDLPILHAASVEDAKREVEAWCRDTATEVGAVLARGGFAIEKERL